jgi:hypothetical protein
MEQDQFQEELLDAVKMRLTAVIHRETDFKKKGCTCFSGYLVARISVRLNSMQQLGGAI